MCIHKILREKKKKMNFHKKERRGEKVLKKLERNKAKNRRGHISFA